MTNKSTVTMTMADVHHQMENGDGVCLMMITGVACETNVWTFPVDGWPTKIVSITAPNTGPYVWLKKWFESPQQFNCWEADEGISRNSYKLMEWQRDVCQEVFTAAHDELLLEVSPA